MVYSVTWKISQNPTHLLHGLGFTWVLLLSHGQDWLSASLCAAEKKAFLALDCDLMLYTQTWVYVFGSLYHVFSL